MNFRCLSYCTRVGAKKSEQGIGKILQRGKQRVKKFGTSGGSADIRKPDDVLKKYFTIP